MADYGSQQGRNPRPNPYGHASSFQRDAAFSEIFGGAPPPGRSQTMTSQTPQFHQERAHTMTGHSPEVYMPSRGHPPPMRQAHQSYGPGPESRYHDPRWQPNGSMPPPRNPPIPPYSSRSQYPIP
ncbi:hypothetical protein CIHG_03873 [Coccidioides immitis H538.4]|uniref:Uncharacterized protein n=1 Tax=Coccidioides immitis H538.4 TaxID=396776 RepID=A0A0J8RNC5_COCIT|nr:hypothetical protein CIHG_03873 [Coccidioides immitis H538.4]